MIKELIIDGVRLKRLPGSDYWISKDGTMFKVVKPLLDKQGRYHVTKNSKHFTKNSKHFTKNSKHFTKNSKHFTKNSKHFTRTREQFVSLYDKLK